MITYQKAPNSIHYTDNVIFCSVTKKQIFKCISVLKDENEVIYSYDYFVENIPSIIGGDMCIDIKMIISEALPLSKTAKKERQKMTNKLRYEVLKRDRFRCKYCGATSDYIQLHVDHIKPVSKGGESVESNLQTLCSTCNNGKSDAY
ncbi:HNH endonuclease [Albibacterium profundi]|uniref:HNH endonuclease n=1 Tax=Albibacterium profundi TaxID=3134906 RepID=A0ABV5CEY5_9SPHI